MTDATEQRKLAAIMFTDMVGYSALSQRDEKLAQELLEEHRRLLREIFPRFHGAEIKTIGDAFLVEFNSALEAAQCAIEIQRALAHRNADAPAARQIELKIGIHIGDVVHRGGDVYGDGVNIASRIEPLAGAGGICVSMDVERQIRNALETRFEKLAPTELKNISVPMELFRIVLPWERRSEVRSHKSAVSKRVSVPTRRFALIGGLVLLLIIGIGWWWTTRQNKNLVSPAADGDKPQSIPAKSIAVLPFENLSDDKSNAYFADGIQDEILTKLASIADLKVISRTSTARYKSKPEDLKTVSQQLGVATVLEGTVQRAADKVRINVQLIDARADTHLWAKSYDRDAKDVFAVESEVSQEIADALQAKLSPNETNTLATAPTKDPEAYDSFLKGEYEEREAESSLKPEPFDQAAACYRQAIDRDPKFALAMARLVESRMFRRWFLKSLTDAELPEVKSMAEQALALAPDLADAHIALGEFYYYGHRQYDQALSEFQRAVQLQPNNVRALEYCAYIHRRQGQLELALSELEKCAQQNPRDDALAAQIGGTYSGLRMWSETTQSLERSLALNPNSVIGMRLLIFNCLNATGDIKEARRILASFPPDPPLTGNFLSGSVSNVIGARAYLSVVERNFAAAMKVWEKEITDPAGNRERLCARVAIHVLAGDAAGAQTEAEKARVLVEARLRERPEDTSPLTQLSWIYLALKRNADALKVARQAVSLFPPEKDATQGAAYATGLAEIEARTGETDEAVKSLRLLLFRRGGGLVSIRLLKIDPVWDPIRNDPGFQQLLAGKELIRPNK